MSLFLPLLEFITLTDSSLHLHYKVTTQCVGCIASRSPTAVNYILFVYVLSHASVTDKCATADASCERVPYFHQLQQTIYIHKEKWSGGGARDTAMKSWARMPAQFLVCPNLCLVDFLNLTWSTAILRTEISLVKLWPPHSAIRFGFSKLVVTVLTKAMNYALSKAEV